jgi:hypothetical protein
MYSVNWITVLVRKLKALTFPYLVSGRSLLEAILDYVFTKDFMFVDRGFLGGGHGMRVI